MLGILKMVIIFSIFSSIVRYAIRRRERRKLKKQMLKNQEQMFQMLAGMTESSPKALSLANAVAKQEEEDRISIGWIVFFVIVFAYIFWVLQPWIEALSVLGWQNFKRMLEIGSSI